MDLQNCRAKDEKESFGLSLRKSRKQINIVTLMQADRSKKQNEKKAVQGKRRDVLLQPSSMKPQFQPQFFHLQTLAGSPIQDQIQVP